MKLLFISIILATMLSGCKKPDNLTPKVYKSYSGNYAEKTEHYGIQLTWEY